MIAFEEVPGAEVGQLRHRQAARRVGDIFEIGRPGREARRRPRPRATWPSPPATSVAADLRGARHDAAGQGRRDPADRRHPHRDRAGRPRVRRAARTASERRYDIGNFEAYFRAFVEFALADPAARCRRCGATWKELLACILMRKRAYARAGLLGNPSDGYHGKTISIIVRNFCAEVVLYEWDTVEIVSPRTTAPLRLGLRAGEGRAPARLLRRHPADQGHHQGFVEYCRRRKHPLHDRNFSVRYQSNIPRQVGLAGSSAIIVATLRCLMEFYGIEIPLEAQPSFVLSVEKEELGIAAGLQDRVIQVYEGLVYMDFDRSRRARGGRHSRATTTSRSIPRCCRPSTWPTTTRSASRPRSSTTTSASGSTAARNRSCRRCGASPRSPSGAARRSRSRDAATLGALIDENFDTRRSIYALPAWQIDMVETARLVGATAKFAGSGRRNRRHVRGRGDVRQAARGDGTDRIPRRPAAESSRRPEWVAPPPPASSIARNLPGPGKTACKFH